MKERGMPFNGDMVRALLDGRKTQTRRIMKPQPAAGIRESVFAKSGVEDGHGNEIRAPYHVGGRLWVRETWFDNEEGFVYRADNNSWMEGEENLIKWRPSIHMPRWASRILLEITDVRVERLQDISDEDAIAEGIYTRIFNDPDIPFPIGERRSDGFEGVLMPGMARLDYFSLWERINGSGSWEANPWVWVISFDVLDIPF